MIGVQFHLQLFSTYYLFLPFLKQTRRSIPIATADAKEATASGTMRKDSGSGAKWVWG
jgi:hypothetical protein